MQFLLIGILFLYFTAANAAGLTMHIGCANASGNKLIARHPYAIDIWNKDVCIEKDSEFAVNNLRVVRAEPYESKPFENEMASRMKESLPGREVYGPQSMLLLKIADNESNKFAEWTEKYQRKSIAISLDGQAIAIARLMEPIPNGTITIVGGQTFENTEKVAEEIRKQYGL